MVGNLSGARCRLAYGPADATATDCLLLQQNPDWFYLLIPAHLGSPGQRAVKWVCQITVATLLGNSLRQTVHTHRASVHQAAKLVAALMRVAGVTAGLAESNGILPLGL